MNLPTNLNYEAHMRGCLSNHDREIEQWFHILQETWTHIKHSAFQNPPNQQQPSLLSIRTTSTSTMQADCTCPESNCRYVHSPSTFLLSLYRFIASAVPTKQNVLAPRANATVPIALTKHTPTRYVCVYYS